MADILQKTFDVEVEGHTYTFIIPTIKYAVEIGYKAADVRRRAFPEAMGALGTLDWSAVSFARSCAILELYLTKASTGWPFGIENDSDLSRLDLSAPPRVDFEKFPSDCEDLVVLVGEAFETERARFRSRGPANRRSPGAEIVAGQ